MKEIRINYCMGCMSPLSGDGNCTKCGFNIRSYKKSSRCISPGAVLSKRYLIGKVTGEGGFGITYIGRDLLLDTVIAVKEYFPLSYGVRDCKEGYDNTVYVNGGSADAIYHNGLKKFYNEAKMLSKFYMLEGIVSVRDFFYENSTAYIVMDYVNGLTLKKYVKEKGRISGGEVLQWMKPVIHSLDMIHKAGIIHRDISPDNLILTDDGKLVLVDFGSARPEGGEITQSITVMFKRGYTPEEQYLSRGKQGAWSDIYALCATMYYMITGIVPNESVERMLEDKLVHLSEFTYVDLSLGQKDAIMNGISVKPEERFQSMQELYDALYNKDETASAVKRHSYDIKDKYLKYAIICLTVVVLGCGFGYKIDRYLNMRYKADISVELTSVPDVSAHGTDTPVPYINAHESPMPVPEYIQMQSFTGLTKKQAKQRFISLGDKKLEIKWEEKYSSSVPKGIIITQDIPENTKYYSGSFNVLTLTISRGVKKVKVTNLKGLDYRAAVKKLKSKKLSYHLIWKEDEEKKGIVISQSKKAGELVKQNKEIYITISNGIDYSPDENAPVQTPASKQTPAPEKNGSSRDKKQDISDKADSFVGTIS